MRYKKRGKILITSSWDDGAIQDVKLSELLNDYVMPATFYIAPGNRERKVMSKKQIKKISMNRIFEIGGHTYSHPELSHISDVEQFKEIKKGKQELFNITGKPVISFCYPKGRYNDDVIKNVKRCRFKEARTVDVLNNKIPTDPFRIKPTIHAHPARKEYNGEYWLDIAMRILNDPETNYFHLWGHSWELDKFDLWKDLEKLLKYIND